MLSYRVFSLPKNPLCFAYSSLLPSFGNHWSFYCLHSFTFSRMPYSGNHTVHNLSNCLLSLSNMHLRFRRVFWWLDSSLLFSVNNIPLSGWNIHSLSEGHLGCFQALAIMSKATVNIHMQVSVWTKSFQLLWVNTKECDFWIENPFCFKPFPYYQTIYSC